MVRHRLSTIINIANLHLWTTQMHNAKCEWTVRHTARRQMVTKKLPWNFLGLPGSFPSLWLAFLFRRNFSWLAECHAFCPILWANACKLDLGLLLLGSNSSWILDKFFFCLRVLHFWKGIFNIWSIKCRLITKLITDLVSKLRDESNEPN